MVVSDTIKLWRNLTRLTQIKGEIIAIDVSRNAYPKYEVDSGNQCVPHQFLMVHMMDVL